MSSQLSLSNFCILGNIGEGDHGKIFKAKYLINNQIFAIKEIEINNKKEMDNLNREICIMNSMTNINHPNIMKYFSFFQEKGKVYIVLELINGQNLNKLVEKHQKMNENISQNLIILILKGAINGLCYLHSKKIIHRDISPDNIMIDENNNIKITDFGLSTIYQMHNPGNNNEYEGTVVGKTNFVSNEIFEAFSLGHIHTKYDFKTDIYSLGLTMFYLMTFKLPFDINMVNRTKKRNNNNINQNLYSKELINIVMNMMEENQYKRPSSQQVYNELCNIIGENNMDIYHSIKKIDFNLDNNYIIKRSSFFSTIYSLYSIPPIKSYFEKNNYVNKVDNYLKAKKLKSEEPFIVLKKFLETLKDLKDRKNRLNNITTFIENISDKITIFRDYNKITPKLIIDSLLHYLFFNINEIFPYNNNIAFNIYKKIKDNINISSVVKKKNQELIKYANIFADMFYFLKIKKIICPKCSNVVEEKVDIVNHIEFFESGVLKQLFSEYNSQKYYSNLDKNILCNKCFIMPLNFNEINNIFFLPNILIIHFENDIQIDEYLELKEEISENEKIKYILNSVIVEEAMNNDYFRYNVSVKNKNNDFWIYINDNNYAALTFNELITKGKICTAFYIKENILLNK